MEQQVDDNDKSDSESLEGTANAESKLVGLPDIDVDTGTVILTDIRKTISNESITVVENNQQNVKQNTQGSNTYIFVQNNYTTHINFNQTNNTLVVNNNYEYNYNEGVETNIKSAQDACRVEEEESEPEQDELLAAEQYGWHGQQEEQRWR